MKKVPYDDFIEKYKPIKNHLDDNASFGGTMFETFGAEVQHVVKIANETPKKVWTFITEEGDFIVSGYHLVNRNGYFITEIEAEDEGVQAALNDSNECGLKPEERDLFVAFAKETANDERYKHDEFYAENLADELESYEENKTDENFESLFRVVAECLSDFSDFDTEWIKFIEKNK